MAASHTTLIVSARVFGLSDDPHQPPLRDILMRDGRFIAVDCPDHNAAAKADLRRKAAAGKARVIDATGFLSMPGFANAHYHSYDLLQKGLVEDMPFDV